MAIKGGQILHVGNGVTVIDRVQTGGPGQLSVPTEKIGELGNYKTVAIVRDTPDLQFSLESLDVSPEIEALLTRSYGGRDVADAVTTLGGTAVTSASAAFDADDVGRMVVIDGAGTDGGEWVTTVASVTDANTVEVDDATPTAGSDLALRVAPNGINLSQAVPVDFASQFKAGRNAADPYAVSASVALPFLNLEQVSYRFGLRDNATKTASLRGDSIFYNPGAAFVEEVAGSGAGGQTIVTEHPAYEKAEGAGGRILSVTAASKRLALGVDYTEAYGAETGGAATTTVTLTEAVAADETVRIVYSSPDLVQYQQSVHPSAAVKPAAVKGRDIEIYLGGYDPRDRAGSAANKLGSVQSVTAEWRVQLEKDEELGNHFAVAQDFDTANVNGSVDIKPQDVDGLLALVRKAAGVTDATKVVSASTAVPLPLDIVIKHPDTAKVLTRLHISDARFTVPGYQGRVDQKTTVTMPYESDEGDLIIYER